MLPRTLTDKINTLKDKFPVITITGPRQSGKTTLVRAVFPALPYVSLEEPDIRQFALTDPRGFLSNFPQGAVLDEVQNTPDLFSYLQTIVDTTEARFVLSGSSNYLLMERVSQTLAGRSAVLHLLPFSLQELANGGFTFAQPEEAIFKGQYPRIYDRDIAPTDFYPAYTQTYVERDVRLIKNIADLNGFIQFTQLCAGRVGQLLNYTSLASDAGLSPNTAKSWLSILEASYILYRLQPYHQNFNKRLVKSPKLYFYDTGLACSLLGIRSAEQVTTHFMKGALFENLILNEFVKTTLHRGERTYPYFWQDSRGKEIDCLLPVSESISPNGMIPVEIKAGKTISGSYFSNLKDWPLTGRAEKGFAVYGGDISMQTSDGFLVSWKQLSQIPY
ncbi:MAG TPA: ATP-binding protein [Anaerolineales bacterium]|nr:ATP-binding protein [Anaerolineales bacterium]